MSSAASAQPLTLAGKVAIVTGASRGIGAAVALELANRGAKASVALTFTSPSSEKATEEAVTKINAAGNGAAAIKIQADLRQLDAPKKIVDETTAAFGNSIDILVNNAGCELIKLVHEITAEDYAYCMDLNVRGALFMSQAVLPHLRKPGRIINMSSVGARVGLTAGTVYLTSKAALEGLTRALAAELGPQGHTVNAIEPGPTRSDMMAKIPPEIVEQQKKSTPLQNRVGEPEDIALITAMVAEPQSGWMTGQAISASGGYLMF
ncbi:Short-chain dehydrogenase/reductase SDR [Neofusicoccum parvum]|uniref:Short-chain dehydrogenase/reductase SDR n=2 Tax=Neofusicoccum parvum TaxID=310453 RepID=A0ACB5SD94_9PEZI|nr:putative short-chain dehydrogenase reductase sdr protein [Neofusicoccum parvum UCRNP2]GME35563.1 Short-chain dehydrogenase/reductase SDR [Neofusicoccum parvum]GME35933.1 Short-chain dehydrogenase/reductase SDR [Neofusicoccum parvum]